MDLLKKNEDYIIAKRLQLRDKSLKNLPNMISNFDNLLGKDLTPLEKEKQKIDASRREHSIKKIDAATGNSGKK